MSKPTKGRAAKRAKPAKKRTRARAAGAARSPKKRSATRATAAARAVVAAPAPSTRAAAPAGEATAAAALETLRIDTKHVLDALFAETGSNGGDAAAPRVLMYRESPLTASNPTFAFVGMLNLRRWYVAQDKPNKTERASLWLTVRRGLGKDPAAPDPGGWDGSSAVATLRDIAVEAP